MATDTAIKEPARLAGKQLICKTSACHRHARMMPIECNMPRLDKYAFFFATTASHPKASAIARRAFWGMLVSISAASCRRCTSLLLEERGKSTRCLPPSEDAVSNATAKAASSTTRSCGLPASCRNRLLGPACNHQGFVRSNMHIRTSELWCASIIYNMPIGSGRASGAAPSRDGETRDDRSCHGSGSALYIGCGCTAKTATTACGES